MPPFKLFSRIDLIPEDATHVDLCVPEYLKLDDVGQWYYWAISGGSCVGYKGSWHPEAEANTTNRTTQDYILLEIPNGN